MTHAAHTHMEMLAPPLHTHTHTHTYTQHTPTHTNTHPHTHPHTHTHTHTPSYFDFQGRPYERHESGGEVDAHVFVHGHVHQDKPLCSNTQTKAMRRHIIHTVLLHLPTLSTHSYQIS